MGKMEIIRKMSGFGAPIGDLMKIYLTFIRSHCEQSSNVWHSGLTELNKSDLYIKRHIFFFYIKIP